MTEQIEGCPFCGWGSLRVASIQGDWHVICTSCRAQGPDSRDREKAIEAWNRRDHEGWKLPR